jgi:hypothetical protein
VEESIEGAVVKEEVKMDCEEWLDHTQAEILEVVKEQFGGGQVVIAVPEGTRTIIVWSGSVSLSVVLSCIDSFAHHAADIALKQPDAPSKADIFNKLSQAFQNKSTKI